MFKGLGERDIAVEKFYPDVKSKLGLKRITRLVRIYP